MGRTIKYLPRTFYFICGSTLVYRCFEIFCTGEFKPGFTNWMPKILDILVFKEDHNFSHSEVYFTVKDLWSPMGVLQRGQKVKLM